VGTSKANYHHGVQKLKELFKKSEVRGQEPGDGNDVHE